MTQDEIIEMAIQGHASTRDAICWAMNQERMECAKVCNEYLAVGKIEEFDRGWLDCSKNIALAIRARGEA